MVHPGPPYADRGVQGSEAMDGGEIAAVVIAVFAASAIQTVSGFGFALLCVSVMSLAVDTKTAVVISTLAGTAMITIQAWRERRHADRSLVRTLTIASYVGMPFGLLVFRRADERTLRIILGVAVLVAVVWLAKGVAAKRAGGATEWTAGVLSGALTTSLSTSGPPLVFALQARRLEPDRFRGTISMVFALQNIGAIALFVGTGEVTGKGLTGAAIALPAIVVGQLAGTPFKDRLQGEAFRRLVLVLLTLAGISAIAASL